MSVKDTSTLLGVVEQLPKFTPFFLQMFFQRVVTFPTKEIQFDKISKGLKMAPFVSPVVAGRADRQQGGELHSFEPAYVKPKHVVEPSRVIERLPGERLGGELSPAERMDAIRVDLLEEEDKEITRREEWMAVQAVMEGKVIVKGEDYPEREVDYGRRASNHVSVKVADRWHKQDKMTFDPADDIETWAEHSTSTVSVLVFHKSDWAEFRKFKAVKDGLETTRAGNTSRLELTPQLEKEVQYKGEYGGYFCYVYNGKVEHDDGVVRPLMPKGKLLMAPGGYDGVMGYGAIQDAEAIESGLVETTRYPKNWTTKDPSLEWMMTQSAPLPVLPDPDEFVVVEIGELA